MASKTARLAASVESRPWTSTPIPISVTQRTSAIVPPPALAVALGAAMSCLDAPAPHLRSFNGSRPGKSSGVAATGVAALARGRESGAAMSSTQNAQCSAVCRAYKLAVALEISFLFRPQSHDHRGANGGLLWHKRSVLIQGFSVR